MRRFGRHKLWIITLLLSVPVVVVAAVPNVFQSGTVISSASVNANFAALDTRIAALETAVSRSGAQVVMSNVAGPLPKSVAFQTNGNPILLIVSGTGWSSTGTSPLVFDVQLDAQSIGDVRGYTNEINSHKALPAKVFRLTPAAGNHTLVLVGITGTFDAFDLFDVTVVELAH